MENLAIITKTNRDSLKNKSDNHYPCRDLEGLKFFKLIKEDNDKLVFSFNNISKEEQFTTIFADIFAIRSYVKSKKQFVSKIVINNINNQELKLKYIRRNFLIYSAEFDYFEETKEIKITENLFETKYLTDLNISINYPTLTH